MGIIKKYFNNINLQITYIFSIEGFYIIYKSNILCHLLTRKK